MVLKRFFGIILFLNGLSFSQIVIQIQPPPPYQMRIEDMWNLVITNLEKDRPVLLHGTVTEVSTGLIVDVSTSVFTIQRGTKRIRSKDVGTITINDKNSSYASVINRLSTLPSGSYEICLEVIDANTNLILGTSCLSQEVLNISQVTLIYPTDGTKINNYFSELSEDTSSINIESPHELKLEKTIPKLNSQIVFTWLPPVPISLGKKISYRIKIVELFGQQSPYDAMQSNPMFFSANGIAITSFQYPIAARDFASGRTYAWQIDAFVDGYLLASSEIFSFTAPGGSKLKTKHDTVKNSIQNIRASKDVDDELPSGLSSYTTYNFANNFYTSFKEYSNSYSSTLNIGSLINSLIIPPEVTAMQFRFAGELYGETANRKGTGSDKKPGYGYASLTPSVSLYGIPFALNVLLSTENNSQRQSLNSISFIYDFNAAKDIAQSYAESEGEENVPGMMKFFSNFNSLAIGTNYPSYTPLTMQGVPVSGFSFEFNPGWFYLASAFQKNQRPIDNLYYKRDLYAGRLGIGQKDDSHWFFTGIYANDNSTSIIVDSTNQTITPKSNYVFGVDAKLNLFEDKISVDGEIAASMLTRDNRDADLVNKDIPKIVRNLFHPKISSQIDYAYSVKTTYDNLESSTKVIVGIKMVGPGYITLGNPTLRNDKMEIESRVDQKFLERQISVSAFIKYYKDNLINSKLATTSTVVSGINLGLRFKKAPYLNLSYVPNFMSNNAADPLKKIDFKNHLFTAGTGYNYNLGEAVLGSNLFYMFNKATSLDTASGYTSNNFTLAENLSFNFPLVISASFGMSFLDYFSDYSKITSLDGNISYTFFESWTNTIGAAYSGEKNKSSKVYFYIGSIYEYTENILIELRIEKNNFSDKIVNANDYDELLIRSTIRVRL